MLSETLSFLQTNIIHFGYWISILIFGSVIKSIVKTLKGEKTTPSKISEKIKEKFKKENKPEEVTQEEINSLFPKFNEGDKR
jgi:hypothetical protein